jgi:uncharacterized protein (TIRG00374 family)
MLLKATKIYLPFKRVIISSAGGTFFNLFLPSSIGGDLVRSIDLSLYTRKPREVVATVLLDRISGYVGLVIVAITAVFFGYRFIQDKSVLISLAIITLVLVAILLVLFNRFFYSKVNQLLHSPRAGKILTYIKDVHEQMHIFRQQTAIIVSNILISLLVQIIGPITFYTLALSIGIKISIAYFFIFVPIIGAITMLPISIGGLGLRDAMTIFFFAKLGISKDLAFAMSLLSFLIILIYGVIGGFIYVFTVHHRRIQPHPPSSI